MAVLTAGAIEGGALWIGLIVNTTPSHRLGFYRKTSLPVSKGEFVLFLAPEEARKNRPYAQERLIKIVVAMPGDRITIRPEGVTVNGMRLRNSAAIDHDLNGLAMPRLEMNDYVLREGELLAMSDYHPHSYDGRYFGPIPENSVTVLRPLWTWDAY
jgi:conjugative transfer signal peptidase TraF